MSRFDYVSFDERSQRNLQHFKECVEELEDEIETTLKAPRYKAIALTKLEEVFMFIGKAIRDDQLERSKEDE